MSFEIERKFLVTGDFKSQAYSSSRIRQGYISTVGKATVRVRIRDDKGYLTIKGRSNEAGISRYEFETEVPLQDAEDLMRLCEPGVIDKTRYLVRNFPTNKKLLKSPVSSDGKSQAIAVTTIPTFVLIRINFGGKDRGAKA